MPLGESNSVVVALVFHQGLRANQGRIAGGEREMESLKHATFLSHGRKSEVSSLHARTVVSSKFSN